MTGIVIWAGLDVHTSSTHTAAIDVSSGEVVRRKFGPSIEEQPREQLSVLAVGVHPV